MLSDQKRGWQGRSGGVVPATKKPGRNGNNTNKKASGRTKTPGTAAVIGSGAKTGPLRAPKDHSQFQRDWRRRCSTDIERREYLRLIGPDSFPALFRVEMEPDVLGQVLLIICSEYPPPAAQQPAAEHLVGTAPSSATPPTVDRPGAGPADSVDGASSAGDEKSPSLLGVGGARYCVDWLWALTRTGRFAVNILFLEGKEKLALARVFDLITAAFSENGHDQDAGNLLSLRKAYAV